MQQRYIQICTTHKKTGQTYKNMQDTVEIMQAARKVEQNIGKYQNFVHKSKTKR
jgi:hypothetical protein